MKKAISNIKKKQHINTKFNAKNVNKYIIEKENVSESLKNMEHTISNYDNDYIDYLKYVSYEKFIQSINKLV